MRTLRALFAITIMIIAGALAALHLAARRNGLSAASQLVRSVILPVRYPADEKGHDALDAALAADRARGPATPPAALRKRYVITEETVRAARVWTLAPRGPDTGLRILYLHGGAYVYDLSALHWELAAALADRIWATVIVPAYPLAPENDWQPAHALVTALYARLVDQVGAHSIALVGDSAGAGLALAVTQSWRDATLRATQLPLPAALVLLSPWLDVTCADPAQPALEPVDRILAIAPLRRAGSMWAGSLPPTDPRISPLNGSLANLPPIAVFTGTEDLLNPDARRLAARARAESASLALYEYPRQFHGWMAVRPDKIPEAGRALDQAAAFVLLRAGA